jgi:hypothetical protein
MAELVSGIIISLAFGLVTFLIYLYYVAPSPRDLK